MENIGNFFGDGAKTKIAQFGQAKALFEAVFFNTVA